MKFIKIWVYLAVVFLGVPLADARTPNQTELDQLYSSANAYIEAVKNNDIERLMDFFPPQLFQQLAKQTNLDVEQVRQLVSNQLKKASSTVVVDSIAIDLDNKSAGELASGAPYFTIPLKLTATNKRNKKTSIESEFVAFLDNDHWFFVSADNSDFIELMTKAFPGFTNIKLKKPKIETLN